LGRIEDKAIIKDYILSPQYNNKKIQIEYNNYTINNVVDNIIDINSHLVDKRTFLISCFSYISQIYNYDKTKDISIYINKNFEKISNNFKEFIKNT